MVRFHSDVDGTYPSGALLHYRTASFFIIGYTFFTRYHDYIYFLLLFIVHYFGTETITVISDQMSPFFHKQYESILSEMINC